MKKKRKEEKDDEAEKEKKIRRETHKFPLIQITYLIIFFIDDPM